jgi:hypothetical protein
MGIVKNIWLLGRDLGGFWSTLAALGESRRFEVDLGEFGINLQF